MDLSVGVCCCWIVYLIWSFYAVFVVAYGFVYYSFTCLFSCFDYCFCFGWYLFTSVLQVVFHLLAFGWTAWFVCVLFWLKLGGVVTCYCVGCLLIWFVFVFDVFFVCFWFVTILLMTLFWLLICCLLRVGYFVYFVCFVWLYTCVRFCCVLLGFELTAIVVA